MATPPAKTGTTSKSVALCLSCSSHRKHRRQSKAASRCRPLSALLDQVSPGPTLPLLSRFDQVEPILAKRFDALSVSPAQPPRVCKKSPTFARGQHRLVRLVLPHRPPLGIHPLGRHATARQAYDWPVCCRTPR